MAYLEVVPFTSGSSFSGLDMTMENSSLIECKKMVAFCGMVGSLTFMILSGSMVATATAFKLVDYDKGGGFW